MSNIEVADDATLRGRTLVFRDRTHAGEALAEALIRLGWHQQKLVLAIPAGGVEVAVAATEKLGLPLELAVTRKLHIPWNREAGFGAVSWEGDVTLNEPLTRAIGLTHAEIQMVIAEERATIERRLRLYRGDAPPLTLIGKRVVIIDDGLASGYSMLVTLKALRRKGVSEATVAVPTGHTDAVELLRPHADKILCLNLRPSDSFAVADAYRHWRDLTDDDVLRLLRISKNYLTASRAHAKRKSA
jgi:putative phosphoribosyl transferase